MSNLFNKILGNLATRMMLIIFLCIIFITTFFILFSYYNELELQSLRQYDKLKAIVSSSAAHIDGDDHEALIQEYSNESDPEDLLKDPRYQEISNYLATVVQSNGLGPMYTLVRSPESGNFVYGVRSDDFIDFENTYKLPPAELKRDYEIGGTIPMYESENGTWLSAFYPIKNSAGKTVAVVEADIDFSVFTALVNERYFNELLISIGVIILLALFLIPYARKILKADEQQKLMMLRQKNLIEAKNQDIMDSIHYSLRIQNTMLPSIDLFTQNGLEGFVFHQPKDVVAGDFYWIEKQDNYFYFAVADCTGHGVPGAIMSFICHNALNRAVDILDLRETGEILDAARNQIIEQMGKGDQLVKDGMDIAICRLDLNTRELQFSGANNPIYIFNGNTGELQIGEPCKQPVGIYPKQSPFQCKAFQLAKGDLVYLFTDGFADQFGGENGKKLKYRPFRNLLVNNRQLPMQDQANELKVFLNQWKDDFEQVDDICVMGVKV